MAVDGIKTWTPSKKVGGISSYGYVENEQTDAGRDGQTCLATLNSQARTGTGKKIIFLFSSLLELP